MPAKQTGCCRLFLGVPVADDCLTVHQTLVLSQLAVLPEELRLTHLSDGHLTVCFLGAIPVERIDAMKHKIQHCVASLSIGPFSLASASITPFPHAHSHLSAIVVDAQPMLMALNRALLDVVSSFGVKRDKREFCPHVTLLRVPKACGNLPVIDIPTPSQLLVDRLCLYESVKQPDGSRYRVIADFLL